MLRRATGPLARADRRRKHCSRRREKPPMSEHGGLVWKADIFNNDFDW